MSGVSVSIGGNATAAFSAFDSVAKKAESVADRIRNGFQQRIGQRLFDGLTQATAQIPRLLGQSITAASDMAEVTSKTQVVFQSSAQTMLEWAKNSSSAFGTSSAAALSAASDMGNLFRSLEIAPDKAAEMSRSMVELAADLASFNNTSVDEALAAIGSALRGEAEPITRFGVLMNEATLKAEAMAQGLSDGKATLDPATKALAAYSLILSKTTTAQGDFQRTSEGLANSQRIIAAQFADASAIVGEAMVPALSTLAAEMKNMDIQGGAEEIASGFQLIIQAVTTLAPAIKYLGGLYVGLKITSFITSLLAKVQAWRAATAAVAANTAALRANAAAGQAAAATPVPGKATAGKGLGMRGALVGGAATIAVAGAAALIQGYLDNLTTANNEMMSAFERGNAAMEKFNVSAIKSQVASREEVEKTTKSIQEEITALEDARDAQLDNVEDPELAERIIKDTEATVNILRAKAKAIANVTDAQLAANAATRAAAEAERKQQAELTAAKNTYAQKRKEYEQRVTTADEQLDGTGSLEKQLESLNRADAAIRGKMSQKSRTGTTAEIISRLDQQPDSVAKTKDLELALKLEPLEKKRAELTARLAEEQEKIRQSKAQALEDWKQEMQILNATILGNETKVKALEKEAQIRQEIARLMEAGFSESEARSGAEQLVAGRIAAEETAKAQEKALRLTEARRGAAGILADAEAAAAGKTEERKIEKRASEISEQTGASAEEARKIASNESALEKINSLQQQRDNLRYESGISDAASTQRIGGGGGAVSSGIDIARQQLGIQQQMVDILAEMRANMPTKSLDN